MFGVAATIAARSEFEHSGGHHLENWWNRQQPMQEASRKREAEEADGGPQAKRQKLTGKQRAPVGMYDEPQVETHEAEPIQLEDENGHVLMVTGPIIWCSLCGRYQTSKRTCRLRDQCPKEARAQIPLSAQTVAKREAPCNRQAFRGNRTATDPGKAAG